MVAKDGKKIADMSSVYSLCKEEKLTDDIIFYNEGETVDNNSSRSYFASFLLKADNMDELNTVTRLFYEKLKVYSPDGENIIYPSLIDNT